MIVASNEMIITESDFYGINSEWSVIELDLSWFSIERVMEMTV